MWNKYEKNGMVFLEKQLMLSPRNSITVKPCTCHGHHLQQQALLFFLYVLKKQTKLMSFKVE